MTARTVLVTGASRGIGRALVGHLRDGGHRVIGTCRNDEDLDGLQREGIEAVPLDTSDPRSAARLCDAVAARTDHIDVLVNNAGIKRAPGRPWSGSAGPLPELDPCAVASVLSTNVIGTLLSTQALIPLLRPGSVVANISSQLGSLERGVDVDYAYNASKAALNMVTVTMQRDLAERGIAAVAINPGWMRTEMGGCGAPLAVEDATADLARLITRLDASFGGRFVDRHGAVFPW